MSRPVSPTQFSFEFNLPFGYQASPFRWGGESAAENQVARSESTVVTLIVTLWCFNTVLHANNFNFAVRRIRTRKWSRRPLSRRF